MNLQTQVECSSQNSIYLLKFIQNKQFKNMHFRNNRMWSDPGKQSDHRRFQYQQSLVTDQRFLDVERFDHGAKPEKSSCHGLKAEPG